MNDFDAAENLKGTEKTIDRRKSIKIKITRHANLRPTKIGFNLKLNDNQTSSSLLGDTDN